MEVANLDQFVTNLSNSELLAPEKLAEVRKAAASASDAKSFAVALVKQKLLTTWQAGQLLIGRTSFLVGRYRLLQHLGRGGMGSVFLAEHMTMNRRVALKMLSKTLGQNPGALERFFAEARAVASLDHPNIVQAYSADNDGDRYYMVMEYVDGKDLGRIVEEKGPLDYAEAAEIIRQAAEGLVHAHAKNMVHCDIKPANLLINTQGTVKILDLGLARLTGDDQSASDEHKVLGTVDYMAPEQGLQSHTFDQRADIYSLGCTLYFLLAGRAPFPEGSLAQRIVKHQTEEPASILERRPDAPKTLVKICRKMMAKDPAQRYQSANEVVKALAEWNPNHRELKRAVPLEEGPPSEDPLAEIAAMEFAQRAASTHVRVAPARPRSAAARRAEQRKQWLIIGGAIGCVVLLVVVVIVVLATTSGEKPRGPIPAGGDSPKRSAKTLEDEKKKAEDEEKEMYRKRWPGIDFSDDAKKTQGGFQGPDAKVTPPAKKPQDKPKGDKK